MAEIKEPDGMNLLYVHGKTIHFQDLGQAGLKIAITETENHIYIDETVETFTHIEPPVYIHIEPEDFKEILRWMNKRMCLTFNPKLNRTKFDDTITHEKRRKKPRLRGLRNERH